MRPVRRRIAAFQKFNDAQGRAGKDRAQDKCAQ